MSPIVVLGLSMLLSSLGTSIANVALPTFTEYFAASFQHVQWIVLSYILASTIFIVNVGKLGDLFGHRRVLLAGLYLFAGASLVCAAAPLLWILIAGRIGQGLGAATMLAESMALMSQIVPKEKIGSAMGLLGTTSAIGTTMGPAIGGALIASLGWRSIFFVKIPLTVFALVLGHRCLPIEEAKPADKRPFDLAGTFLLALALTAYSLAVTVGKGEFGTLNVFLLLIAGFGAYLLTRAESRADYPVIPFAYLRREKLTGALLASTLVSTVMMASLVVGPFYLSMTLGLSAAMVGITMSVGPLVAALCGVPAGGLVDRFGAGTMTMTGLFAIAAGCILLSLLPTSLGVSGYLVPISILTSGYALFQAANNTSVMKDSEQGQRGVIAGLLSLSRNIGLISGAAVMGAIFAAAAGGTALESASPEAIAFGMNVTFGSATLLIALAGAFTYIGRELNKGTLPLTAK